MVDHRTQEQVALSEERKLKRQQNAALRSHDSKGSILYRRWMELPGHADIDDGGWKVKILSWNLLAQCLVRRELFLGSDCLKASQREHMIHREILSQGAHIVCLQEVDRLEKLLPVLEDAGYAHSYAAGPGKLHGCLIAFDRNLYFKTQERIIYYDEQEVGENRRGNSIRTSNVGSLIALKSTQGNRGLVIATTHLFWHPRYAYERARQAGILLREVSRFRDDTQNLNWPCIICGDFNFSPDEAAYSLLVGDPVSPAQEETLSMSRVVHVSVEFGEPLRVATKPTEGSEYNPATDPDKIITDARPAVPQDGLLSTDELTALFSASGPVRSAYDEAQQVYRVTDATLPVLGDRVRFPPYRKGAHEPMWTSYTHYWKTVLDYIFVLDSKDGTRAAVAALLEPHRTQDIRPGLPKSGVCGSDHISLCVELLWKDHDP